MSRAMSTMMKRVRVGRVGIAVIVVMLLGVVIAGACESDSVAKFVNIAVDRCMARNVTLSFDMGKRGDRAFVTVSHEDGRKMYEALKQVYGVKP